MMPSINGKDNYKAMRSTICAEITNGPNISLTVNTRDIQSCHRQLIFTYHMQRLLFNKFIKEFKAKSVLCIKMINKYEQGIVKNH
jgi:hypothetical protein